MNYKREALSSRVKLKTREYAFLFFPIETLRFLREIP